MYGTEIDSTILVPCTEVILKTVWSNVSMDVKHVFLSVAGRCGLKLNHEHLLEMMVCGIQKLMVDASRAEALYVAEWLAHWLDINIRCLN